MTEETPLRTKTIPLLKTGSQGPWGKHTHITAQKSLTWVVTLLEIFYLQENVTRYLEALMDLKQ